jgi:hypothetical protein
VEVAVLTATKKARSKRYLCVGRRVTEEGLEAARRERGRRVQGSREDHKGQGLNKEKEEHSRQKFPSAIVCMAEMPTDGDLGFCVSILV